MKRTNLIAIVLIAVVALSVVSAAGVTTTAKVDALSPEFNNSLPLATILLPTSATLQRVIPLP